MGYQTIFFAMIAIFLRPREISGYFELVEELGCHDTEFRLSCGSLEARIAVLEATFTGNDSFLEPVKSSCGNPGRSSDRNFSRQIFPDDPRLVKILSDGTKEINFRHVVNRRCSGVNYCSFILAEDDESASKWGPGAVYLRYACTDGVHVTKTCNSDLDAESEGFVETPGYPRFYVGGRTCRWTLRTSSPRQIRVSFLDVSLRGMGPGEKICSDRLVVAENGSDLFSTCGDVLGDTVLDSQGPILNVTLTTASKNIFPKRGLLFHYKAVGCPSPRKPRDGYIVFKNDSFAHYRCCVGFVFPGTFKRNLFVRCRNENTWDYSVPDCINITIVNDYPDLNFLEIYGGSEKDSAILPLGVMEEKALSKDVIVPAVVMCILFVGNGILLLIILHYRKKLTAGNDPSGAEESVEKSSEKTRW